VPLGEIWRYAKGTANPPSNWAALGFDDSSWLSGPSGFGFSDNDDATVLNDMQNNYTTVFTRKSFTVFNVNTVSKVSVLYEFDDGFAVYLNGSRFYARNAPATITNTSVATGTHEASLTLIRQDFTDTATRNLLVNGTNVIAAVGLNASLSSGDLTLKIVLELTGGTNSPVDVGGDQTPIAVWLGAGPNPFAADARVAFRLGTPGTAWLDVYDAAGRLVRGLTARSLGTGEHAFVWDGKDAAGATVSPGVYVYRLRAPGIERSGKLTRAR
jgi:hypothetical protein